MKRSPRQESAFFYYISKFLLGTVSPLLLLPLLFAYLGTYTVILLKIIIGAEEKELVNLILRKVGIKKINL